MGLIVRLLVAARRVLGVALFAFWVAGPNSMPLGSAAEPSAASKSRGSQNDRETTNAIDSFIQQGWEKYDYGASSKQATEGGWCRRVYLDVLGRIPTVEELKRFRDDDHSNKKARLVDRLLSDEYVDEYARNATVIWTNILIGRGGGTERGTRINRSGMQQYLRASFLENKPYDRMVQELIRATGTSRPGATDFNGAVNFLADKLVGKGFTAASQATARTTEIFLGIRVQCTQCHDHPFNNWKQNQYWELNAFFRQAAALRRYEGGRFPAFIELVDQDFGGDGKGDDAEEAEIYYERTNKELRVAYPVFTDRDGTRTAISKVGYIDEVNRRRELARLIVGSQYLSRAIVNRMWARFLGFGLVTPVDDMGPHNPPSHPELIEWLAKDFKAANYDLKKLIRWITLSKPYSLSSQSGGESGKDLSAQSTHPLFDRFYMRQMRPEELYESVLTATEGAPLGESDIARREAARDQWVRRFVVAEQYVTENNETTTFNGSIPQTLTMFNGDLIRKAIETKPGSFLHGIAQNKKLSAEDKVNSLFLTALSRKPTKQELSTASALLRSRPQDPASAMQDLWWSLINMNEFILNH